MKEQIIQIPDTLEIKEIKDGKIILVEKEKKLTYEDVVDKMFPYGAYHYYIQTDGNIYHINNAPSNRKLSNSALSKKQLEKLLAINKLMNVAKYLNGDWQPDWDNRHEKKYYFYVEDEQIRILYADTVRCLDIYFKSIELARKAMEILGEETIKLALCTDY